jgi:two-component system response regulator HydG
VDAEIEWLNGDGESALDKLIEHANRAARLGYGYEHLLTARRIVTVADSLDLPDVANEWWTRTEYLAEAGGARPMFERWRKIRQELGFLSPEDPALAANFAPPSPDPAGSSLADELPRVDLRRFGIITACRRLENQASIIAKLAPTKVPVLIHGQSGTGKELFARLVHELSPRASQSFLAINCGALPAEILESELFGHRRGAFTGAIYDKPGLFREAHQGTLFLDEIGEMSASAQAKLLRVLETGELRPVGGTKHEVVDVRIVAATNVDLVKAVESGRFRKDLYFRLRGLEVTLPPLRERLGDIPPLALHFVEQANLSQGKSLELTFETTQWLMGQSWPGNVRELRLAIERAVALAGIQGFLYPRHFLGVASGDDTGSLPAELEEIERARVRNALESADWNTAAAARVLGMSRTTLAGRIKKLGIEKPRSR